MTDGTRPAEWLGRHVVVTFPEHLDAAAAGQVGQQLLGAIADGATVVVADMSATVSCEQAGFDMLGRACLRAAITQAELRLVAHPATAELISSAGLDRMVAVFGSVPSALASREHDRQGWLPAAGLTGQDQPGQVQPDHVGGAGSGAGQVTAAVLRQLLDSLDDGIILADADGTILLASRRLAAMFGYEYGELTGRPVECLLRGALHEVHREHRLAYTRAPAPRLMNHRERLAGTRKDGSSLPVTITLRPVVTASGHFVLAIVRDATRPAHPDDLASMAWAAAAEQDERSQELLGRVSASLLQLGQSLEAAVDLPAGLAGDRLTAALEVLDDVIYDIRDHLFRVPGRG